MASEHPQEEVYRLDPTLLKAYEATPWIVVTADSYEKVRAGGGVSAAAAIPDSVEVIHIDEDGVEGWVYRSKTAPVDNPLLVWYHGGGYVFGHPTMHAGLYLQFLEAGISVFAAKYRRAPEATFPAQSDDGLKAWDYITSGRAKAHGVAPAKVAVGGTSAGGGLAATVAIQLRDLKHPVQPSAVALNIPWLASPPTTDEGKSSWHTIKFDKIWSLANCRYASGAFFPPGTDDPKKYAFPYDHPSLHDLPPTIVSVAELDILRDSGIEYAQRLLAESANGADLHVYKGSYHGSTGAVPNAPVSKAQDQQQVRFVSTAFGLSFELWVL